MYIKKEESEKDELITQNHTLFFIWYITENNALSKSFGFGDMSGNVSAVQGLDLSPMEYLENKVMTKAAHKGKEIDRLTTLE